MTCFLGIAGLSGSGKTVLIENIIPKLVKKGLKPGVIKHTHHSIETDKKGSDTQRHKAAGAETVILAGPERITLFKEYKTVSPVELAPFFADMDIVLAEGFKDSTIKKIEVIRTSVSEVPVCAIDSNLIAFVSDNQNLKTALPVFKLDDYAEITDFIIKQMTLK